MPQPEHSSVRNRLLKALSADDFALLQPHLQPLATELRQTLIAPNAQIKQLFFPEVGFGSITTNCSGGKVEIGIIGREGLVGASPVLLGSDRTPHHHFIQSAGEMLSIKTEVLCVAVGQSSSLHKLLLRSIQVQLIQTAQTAFVNATYTVDVRLARWLLMCQDRLDDGELHLTHEFLSMMLGVQRSSTTLSVQALEGRGLIRARRGRITVLDREALVAVADDGYGLPEAEYARLIEGA
ncbi:CRP-like cAMP-binding protein [Methylobacterium sp. BE186]|uniref:Crp/Fnr family transcriptional regulator n=1 Tax=Methylobacterium sp. BE186 TaxID=2817715 RepID=UPI00286399C9|nr:Crp/Fnr family transcriptional regulator [Methylobacterium sp. BE186]MDR7037793.1 CRP-like cAMP-binding protein [Methylobacterium sp. BE186]